MSDYLIDLDTGGWVWQRAKTTAGYGTLTLDGRTRYAHRAYYECYVADIPEGFVLDHLCAPDGERRCRECNRIRGRARTQRWAADFRARPVDPATRDLVRPLVPSVPYGKCRCGCGADTKIAKKTISAKGIVKGEPMSLNGYGQLWHEGRVQRAHRVFYQLYIGPIPEGLQIDHICYNKLCVNPDHLEAMTAMENVHRTRRKHHEN